MCSSDLFRENCRSDAMYHKQFHVVDWLDAWASIGCPTPTRMERFEYINSDYEYPNPHDSNESTSDAPNPHDSNESTSNAKYQTPHLKSSAFHENRSHGREFVLRLKDGRGLTTKHRHVFDDRKRPGRQCLNIAIGVSTGDSATRVHLDGPLN